MVPRRRAGQRSVTPAENRATWALAAIFALRMFGLFMIYPVFSIYALGHLQGASAASIGLALGGYGLTQALLQIPLGWLSDRIGRKVVITGGLALFATGSVVAGVSDSITGVIVGRVLQGAGAIGSTILALAADLTHEQHRTRAMAIIGMTIGASFAVALVGGPLLDNLIGVPGMFMLTAALAVFGIALLQLVVPDPETSPVHPDAESVPGMFRSVLADPQLLRLDFGILTLHMMLTASFIALPLAIQNAAGLDSQHQWQLYLPALVAAVLVMVPFIILAERRGHMKIVFLGAIVSLAACELALALGHRDLVTVAVALTLFFAAFTMLEALLPSLVSRLAPGPSKGTAMGVYSTSQFLGIFIGGGAGGWVFHYFGLMGVFVFAAVSALIWFVVAMPMTATIIGRREAELGPAAGDTYP